MEKGFLSLSMTRLDWFLRFPFNLGVTQDSVKSQDSESPQQGG